MSRLVRVTWLKRHDVFRDVGPVDEVVRESELLGFLAAMDVPLVITGVKVYDEDDVVGDTPA